MDDVSNWYVRLSRRRFWKGEMTADKHTAFTTLYTVLEASLRLLAPFIPFTGRGDLPRPDRRTATPTVSVHLQDFPAADAALVDAELERAMAAAQDVVGLGRSLRQDAGLKTRQPLGRLLLHADDDRAALLLADPRLAGYVAERTERQAGGHGRRSPRGGRCCRPRPTSGPWARASASGRPLAAAARSPP